MNWTKISEEKPRLGESVVLAINYSRSHKLIFWKKKIVAFGWLDEVKQGRGRTIYRYYDHTNDCHWKGAVTHWMTMPEPPE